MKWFIWHILFLIVFCANLYWISYRSGEKNYIRFVKKNFWRMFEEPKNYRLAFLFWGSFALICFEIGSIIGCLIK